MLTQINNTILKVRNMQNTLATTAIKYHHSPAIMDSLSPSLLIQENIENISEDIKNMPTKLESLILGEGEPHPQQDLPSFLLLDANEKLSVQSPSEFLNRLKIRDVTEKVKVVSIFGNTGEGKSHTLNHVFFKENNTFKTSPDQRSCTLGVWAAYDHNQKVICLDTEGLLGITKKQSQRTRLLLKVLAVSDIVIYRTRAERLQTDMYTFLGGASKAYNDHFKAHLGQIWPKNESDTIPIALGPSIIIFHETKFTNTLHMCATVEESPEDILRARFAELNLDCSAFSSIKYVGIKTEKGNSVFKTLENAVHLELDNTKVRSKRSPEIIFRTLKGLNDKFSSEIKNIPPQLHLNEYFTCQSKCQSCNEGCTLSMGHKEKEPHQSVGKCKFQHQYQNCVYLCKRCFKNGQRIIVKPSYQSITEKSWSSYFNYVWSGYIIECSTCGEIYRSRQHWYGNKSPEDGAVLVEYVHVWPDGEYNFQERNFVGSNNSIQKVIDSVTYFSDVVANVGSQPTQAVKDYITDKINPSYWTLDRDITECHQCKKKFAPNATKHHCRNCGEGFCDKCSSKSQPVPSKGWRENVRVCDGCYQDAPPSLSDSIENPEVSIRKYSETAISSISVLTSALKIPTDIIKEHARPAYWVPDSECIKCECCKLLFDETRRLHHCRECGKGVCDDCSKNRKEVPFRGWDYPVRICKNCS